RAEPRLPAGEGVCRRSGAGGAAAGPARHPDDLLTGITRINSWVYPFPAPLTATEPPCYNAWSFFRRFRLFAIIRSGGKQYRVAEGETVLLERDVLGNVEDDKVTFGEVLMIGGDKPLVGAPTVSGASVSGTVVREARGNK